MLVNIGCLFTLERASTRSRYRFDPCPSLLNECLSDFRGRRSSVYNHSVCDWLSIKALIAGFVPFNGCAIEAETRKRALGAAKKEDLCIGIAMGGLTISPSRRSVRAKSRTGPKEASADAICPSTLLQCRSLRRPIEHLGYRFRKRLRPELTSQHPYGRK